MTDVSLDWTSWELLGGFGMICIELSYATQIHKLWVDKEAGDISLSFPGLNLLGRIFAMVSSFAIGSQVFGMGFTIGIALRLVFFLQVVWYRRFPGGRAPIGASGHSASASGSFATMNK